MTHLKTSKDIPKIFIYYRYYLSNRYTVSDTERSRTCSDVHCLLHSVITFYRYYYKREDAHCDLKIYVINFSLMESKNKIPPSSQTKLDILLVSTKINLLGNFT